MASFDREFLVHYLQDIYALFLARRRLDNEIQKVERKISKLQKGKPNTPPSEPEYESNGGIGFYAAAVFFSVMGLYMVLLSGGEALLLIIPIAAFSGILVLLGLRARKKAKKRNEEKLIEYRTQLANYELIEYQNAETRKGTAPLRTQLSRYNADVKKINSLINQQFSINIIPGRYRDLYAVAYLYDYFVGSHENDLAIALNTYVLEQIKERLDIMIENQSQMILNQYTIIGNQQRAYAQQAHFQQQMMGRLDQIDTSNEERNTYLRMIEGNTATTAFFASADYFSRF